MGNGNAQAVKPQFVVHRKIGTMTYSAFSQPQTIDIPILNGLRYVDLRFNGQVDISGGTADGASLAESPWSFLTEVRLQGNGREPLVIESGEGLERWNFFERGVRPTGTALSSLSAANSTLSGFVRIDLALAMGLHPVDTAVLTTLFQVLQLIVSVGGKANLVTSANDRTFAFDTFVIDVYTGEVLNFNAALFGKFFAKRYYIESTDSGASTNFEMDMPTGNFYHSLLLETAATSAGYDTVSTVLNNLQIRVGGVILVDAEDDELQENAALEAGVAIATGWYPHFFTKDGLLTECLDVRNISNLKAILDKNAVTTTRTRLHVLEIIPIL